MKKQTATASKKLQMLQISSKADLYAFLGECGYISLAAQLCLSSNEYTELQGQKFLRLWVFIPFATVLRNCFCSMLYVDLMRCAVHLSKMTVPVVNYFGIRLRRSGWLLEHETSFDSLRRDFPSLSKSLVVVPLSLVMHQLIESVAKSHRLPWIWSW